MSSCSYAGSFAGYPNSVRVAERRGCIWEASRRMKTSRVSSSTRRRMKSVQTRTGMWEGTQAGKGDADSSCCRIMSLRRRAVR